MWSKIWWQKVADRVVRAGAYTLITLISSDLTKIKQLDWDFIALAAAVMMLLSFCGSIVTTGVGPDKQDPSTR